jgi:hypothetical protein
MLHRYYQLLFADDAEYAPYGVAYGPDGVSRIDLVPENGILVRDWQPLDLTLRGGEYADYLANSVGLRLCSVKMRDVIEAAVSPNDVIQWLNANVYYENQKRDYFAIHFPMDFPVINKKESTYFNDSLIRPVLAKDGVHERQIFGIPGALGLTTYISEKLKRMIMATRLAGMSFSEVAVK